MKESETLGHSNPCQSFQTTRQLCRD